MIAAIRRTNICDDVVVRRPWGVEPRMIRHMPTRMAAKVAALFTPGIKTTGCAVAIHGYGGCPNGAGALYPSRPDDFLAWAES